MYFLFKMSARYVSSKLITNVQKSGRTIAVDYVDKTTAWVRPKGFPTIPIRNDFAQVVKENFGAFSAETVKVAMK